MKTASLGILIAFVIVSCAPLQGEGTQFPTLTVETPTEATTARPIATLVTVDATATESLAAIPGSTTTQVNVRQQPMASGHVIGTLPASAAVEVLTRDPGGNWYKIRHEAGEGATAWVAAQYIAVAEGAAIPLEGTGAGPLASVRERINIRSGPGTQFDGVGLLSAGDAVVLTAKDLTGTWLQIAVGGDAHGRGWVAAPFLEGASVEGLPVVGDDGEVVGTGTPPALEPSPPAEPKIALDDGDSPDEPSLSVRFSPAGEGAAFYTSGLSAPDGDKADWIQVTPYYDYLLIRLDCRGTGTIDMEASADGSPLAELAAVKCGSSQGISVRAGVTYSIKISTAPAPSGVTAVGYTVSLFGIPPY